MLFRKSYGFCFAQRADFLALQPFGDAFAVEQVSALEFCGIAAAFELAVAHRALLLAVLFLLELLAIELLHLGFREALRDVAYLLSELQKLLSSQSRYFVSHIIGVDVVFLRE